MGGASGSTNRGMSIAYRGLVGTAEVSRPLGRPRC